MKELIIIALIIVLGTFVITITSSIIKIKKTAPTQLRLFLSLVNSKMDGIKKYFDN